MKILNFKEYRQGNLIGYFAVELDNGLIIKGLSVHKKNNSTWVAMPLHRFTTADGQESAQILVHFSDKNKDKEFKEYAKQELQRYLGKEI